MQKLVSPTGSIRRIGVSNFSPEQMNDIMQLPGPKPFVHQFELHPYLQQTKFVKWHHDNNVSMTAYAPLANTSPAYRGYDKSTGIPLISNNPVLSEIKVARGCASEAQVTLAWNIQRGISVIPKAEKPAHQDENLQVDKCRLTEEDMSKIASFAGERNWVARLNNPCRMYQMPCFKELEKAAVGAY